MAADARAVGRGVAIGLLPIVSATVTVSTSARTVTVSSGATVGVTVST